MAVSTIPLTVTESTVAATVPAINKQYKVAREFKAGIYNISCVSTTIATVNFLVGTSLVTAVTVSGSVSIQLGSSATEAMFEIDTGTDIVVTITRTGSAITPTEISGTLDTVTTTSTYNQTGKLWVLAVGGGGRGAAGYGTNQYFNLGGGQGGACADGVFYTNTATSVTIGAGGVSGGSNPGATTFGNLLTAAAGANGADNQQGGTGGAVTNPASSVTTGNNGGGGQGATGTNTRINGTGSGIGTGGAGAATTSPNAMNGGNGQNGTGYGAGGGGSINSGNVVFGAAGAGNGTSGVVYVLRGW